MDRILAKLSSFFIFCSGASKEILDQCPEREYNKYQGIGFTVFLTGVLASISGGYAIYYIFFSSSLSIILGIIWGILIFNLDRFIVSNIVKSESFIKELGKALPRIVFAIVIAIVIARPIELKLFEPEINQQLSEQLIQDQLSLDKTYESLLDTSESKLNEQIRNLTNQFESQRLYKKVDVEREEKKLAQFQSELSMALERVQCECNGVCGTKRAGRGAACRLLEEEYSRLRREYSEVKSNYEELMSLKNKEDKEIYPVIDSLLSIYRNERDNRVKSLMSEKEAAITKLRDNYAFSFLARNNSLSKLSKEDGGVNMTIMLITSLFVLIEISPVLVTLLSVKGEYDLIIIREQEKLVNEIKIARTKTQNELNELNFEFQRSQNSLKGTVNSLNAFERIKMNLLSENYRDAVNELLLVTEFNKLEIEEREILVIAGKIKNLKNKIDSEILDDGFGKKELNRLKNKLIYITSDIEQMGNLDLTFSQDSLRLLKK